MIKTLFILLLFCLPQIVSGEARYFDGDDDFIKLSTGIESVQMTVEFKVNRLEDIAAATNYLFVGENTWAQTCDWTVGIPASQKLDMAWFDAGWHHFEADVSPNTLMPMNDWTHVACVRAGTGLPSEGKIYINGEEVAVTAIGVLPPNLGALGNEIQIGGDDTYGLGWFEAEFDDVRVWTVERSQEQIQSYMDISIPGDMPGLVINIRMDEKTGVPKNYATGFYDSVTMPSEISGTLSVDNAHGKIIIGN